MIEEVPLDFKFHPKNSKLNYPSVDVETVPNSILIFYL